MLAFYILIFIACFGLLYWISTWLIDALIRIARYLDWREFTVAFLVMAIVGAIPNFFIGISSALHKIPQLSFGEIVGGNVIDLTLAVAIATLLIRGGIPAKSRVVQVSSKFTILIAILPLLLIFDGTLSRGDGIILISAFLFYIFWLFSKKERFTMVYEDKKEGIVKEFKTFLKDIGRILIGIILLLLAAEGIVNSASFFAESLNFSIALIGILIVGFGNALPEMYFAIISAKRGQTWMILGNLMGSVIIPSTLVLGTVALICPIEIIDFSPFAIGRFFLIISVIFFLVFVRTDKKITKKEAIILLAIYLVFILVEILVK